MSSIRISIQGLPQVQAEVDGLTKGMRQRLQRVTKKGATQFKSAAQAEARPLSKRLARSVSVRAGKREKPSAVLTFRPAVAWFRHFIIGGTRDHGPRKARILAWKGPNGRIFARRVRGVPPHPILERVFAARQQAASNAMADELLKE